MTSKRPRGIVVGGGIGGLVTAILLSARGHGVTLLEANERLGGKLQPVQLGRFAFDFGPSTITMPWIFEQVFREAGQPVDPRLTFHKLGIKSRNRFHDGTTVDLSADPHAMELQLAAFAAEDRRGFLRYLRETERIYRTASEQFFTRSFSSMTDFLSPKLGAAFLSVHPFQKMDAFHRSYFRDPRLLAMMNRYATYVGSSPYETPATLSMIAYLELVRGVYYIEGGNYRLVEALEALARRVGVEIRTGTPVQRIWTRHGRAAGVLAAGESLDADWVVSNADYFTAQQWIEEAPSSSSRHARQDADSGPAGAAVSAAASRGSSRAGRSVPLSSSGYLCLFGTRRPLPGLAHHNMFFPEDYGSEFRDMFDRHTWPQSPALYVCCPSVTAPDRVDGAGSTVYALLNVPAEAPAYRSGVSAEQVLQRTPEQERPARSERYRHYIAGMLSRALQLPDGLDPLIEEEAAYGPEYIAARTGSYGGALYGSASHGWRPTFFRPGIADRRHPGLYYAGGSTHPGGGTPMVTLSGMLAAKLIAQRH